MGRTLYEKDFSTMTEEEVEAFMMEDTPLEQVKSAHPEWWEQLDRLEKGIREDTDALWENGIEDKARFALILNKCCFFTKLWRGKILAVRGPLPGEASIVMELPSLVLVRDVDENLLRYLGRYAHGFAVHPKEDGIRVTIDLPYPQAESNVVRLR